MLKKHNTVARHYGPFMLHSANTNKRAKASTWPVDDSETFFPLPFPLPFSLAKHSTCWLMSMRVEMRVVYSLSRKY